MSYVLDMKQSTSAGPNEKGGKRSASIQQL